MPRVQGAPYRLRHQNRIASEMRVSVEGSRSILMDRELAMRTAKGRITRGLKGGLTHTPDYAGGKSLHDGLTAMAERSEVGAEMYARIERMDEQVLAEMYSQSKLTFEVVFNYEGLRRVPNEPGKGADSYEVINRQQKLEDFQYLVDEYNRFIEGTGRSRKV